MTFGTGFEILCCQCSAVWMAALGIGHVHHQPQASAGDLVQRGHQLINSFHIRLLFALHQLMGKAVDGCLGSRCVADDALAAAPAGKGWTLFSVIVEGALVGK